MRFLDSATIKEGDGECVGVYRKFIDILIEFDTWVINCKAYSVSPIHDSMARVIDEEQHILFEVFRILGALEEIIVKYFIYLFCFLIYHLDYVLKALHMLFKEFSYRSHVFICLRKGLWGIQIAWGANEQCFRYYWNNGCGFLHIKYIYSFHK